MIAGGAESIGASITTSRSSRAGEVSGTALCWESRTGDGEGVVVLGTTRSSLWSKS